MLLWKIHSISINRPKPHVYNTYIVTQTKDEAEARFMIQHPNRRILDIELTPSSPPSTPLWSFKQQKDETCETKELLAHCDGRIRVSPSHDNDRPKLLVDSKNLHRVAVVGQLLRVPASPSPLMLGEPAVSCIPVLRLSGRQ